MPERHIFLIGMPGSGKSSLGRRAAQALGLRFVDMDQEISDAMGCTVSDIFEKYGEEGFRNAETHLLIRLTNERPALISTGGGTVLRPLNREIMKGFGLVVLINRPLSEILSDIRPERRPLLAAKGPEEVERLYRERIDIYRALADLTLVNSGDYETSVDGLIRLIRSRVAI